MLFASEEKIPMGIRFEGSRARIYVNRARIECGPDSFQPVLQAKLPSDYQADVFRDASPAHVRNFLDCVKSRQDPITPVEIGHRTNIVCQLSDVATRLKRRLAGTRSRSNSSATTRPIGTSPAACAPWRMEST